MERRIYWLGGFVFAINGGEKDMGFGQNDDMILYFY